MWNDPSGKLDGLRSKMGKNGTKETDGPWIWPQPRKHPANHGNPEWFIQFHSTRRDVQVEERAAQPPRLNIGIPKGWSDAVTLNSGHFIRLRSASSAKCLNFPHLSYEVNGNIKQSRPQDRWTICCTFLSLYFWLEIMICHISLFFLAL